MDKLAYLLLLLLINWSIAEREREMHERTECERKMHKRAERECVERERAKRERAHGKLIKTFYS